MTDPAHIPPSLPPLAPSPSPPPSVTSTVVEPSVEPARSPPIPNHNNLSQTTSRSDPPSNENSTSRTIRDVTATFSPEKASDELDDLILRRTELRRPSAIVDKGLLYPTLENHPEPHPYPLLVLNLAAISHVSQNISNDELLEVLLRRLEPWVGEDGVGAYCLVVLATEGSGQRALPGVGWWFWHWRRIPRKYRKNLKRLYIVHPSTLTRAVLPVILPLVSPKSYTKVHSVPSLMALTHFNVSLCGIDLSIPTMSEEARILAENPNAARRTSITDALGRRTSASVPPPPEEGSASWGAFSVISAALGTAASWLHPGVTAAFSDKDQKYWARDIDSIVAENHGHVPRVLGVIGAAIVKHCTTTEGIFRRSSNSPLVNTLINFLDLPLHLQPRLDWAALAQHDPLLLPIVFKRVISTLRTPVFMQSTYPLIRTTRSIDDISTKLIPALSPARAQLLSVVLHIAHHLAPFEATTRMGALQLALMLAPSLVSGPDPREYLALLMEPGVMVPAGLAALAARPPSPLPLAGVKKHVRSGSASSEMSKTSKRNSKALSLSPESALQALPQPPAVAGQPGQAETQDGLPAQTLVGVLEIWIKEFPALHGKDKCECPMSGVTTSAATVVSPVTPVAPEQQHPLLNAGTPARATPVATAS